MNTTHRLIIFNRATAAPVDGWIHVVPKGELPNAAAGIVQVLDDASLDSILANIKKDQNRLGVNWPGVYAGREHFIYDAGQDSEALAWFKEFEKRPNGIWARDDGLTNVGANAIKNRLYKFTSFVADPADLERVEGESSSVSSSSSKALPRYRVMKIETVGFTNHANGRELLTPIANRDLNIGAPVSDPPCLKTNAPGLETGTPRIFATASAAADSDPSALRPGAAGKTINQGPKMKSVCTLLGLSAEADEGTVHTAVSKLLNRGDITPDALATLKTAHKALGEQNQILLGEQTEALLDACAVKEEKIRNRLADAMKLLKNRQERLGYLADFGYVPGHAPNGQDARATTRVLNRGTGAHRESTASTFLAGEGEQVVAIKIQNRTSELQGKGLKYDSAWNQARREVLGKV